MMRLTRLLALVGIAWWMQTGTSYAADWLDKLSGPGPFWGLSLHYRFACISSPPANEKIVTWLSPVNRSSGILPIVSPASRGNSAEAAAAFNCSWDQEVHSYLTANIGFRQSFQNELFPGDPHNDLYRVRILDMGVTYAYRVSSAVDLSVTASLNRFTGDAFDPLYRAAITPGVVIAPFAFTSNTQRSRAFGIGAGWTMFSPGFDAADFCNRPSVSCAGINTRFKSRMELIPQITVFLDPVIFRKGM